MDLQSPKDWTDLPDWDRYWSDVLADGFWRETMINHWSCAAPSYLQGVQIRQGHRVLFAGNGISVEPYGFARMGCDATVVDVSAVACRFLSSLKITPRHLAPLFPVYDDVLHPSGFNIQRLNVDKICQQLAQETRPGGKVSIINADFFTYEPDRPFGAIFSSRSYQGLPSDDRAELARRFFRWLEPRGIAFIEVLNVRSDNRKAMEEPFLAAGFAETTNWLQTTDSTRRVAFIHGSG